MNTIERRNRRVKRFTVLTKINEIEQANCLVCPNRLSTDLSCCKVCPVPGKLYALGKQLECLSDRADTGKIEDDVEDEPEVIAKVIYHFSQGKMRKKRKPLTAEEIISGVAIHGNMAVFARSLGKSEKTVQHRAYALGLKGLKKAEALEILRKKEGELA